jgi:hypothetical protein
MSCFAQFYFEKIVIVVQFFHLTDVSNVTIDMSRIETLNVVDVVPKKVWISLVVLNAHIIMIKNMSARDVFMDLLDIPQIADAICVIDISNWVSINAVYAMQHLLHNKHHLDK